MKKSISALIIGCALFSPLCNAHVSKAEAIKMFNKLVKIAKIKNHPSLKFNNEKDFNGFTNGSRILITAGMLKLTNKAELAGVLGHEITHWKHNDYYSPGSMYNELRADREGLYLAEQAGYNHCDIIQFMAKARSKDGEDDGDGVHPGWTYRYNTLRGECK
jgi:predicted Zn-dependent protease